MSIILILGFFVYTQTLNNTEIDTTRNSHQHKKNVVNFLQPRGSIVDSAGNGYTLWTQMQECISYNPTLDAIQIVNRAYEPSGCLNVHQAPGYLSYSVNEYAVYNREFGNARYPTSVASGDGSGNGPHISFATLDTITGNWGHAGAQYESGGWFSGSWAPPVDLSGDIGVRKNIGKQLLDGNILFIASTTTDEVIYWTCSPDISTTVSS